MALIRLSRPSPSAPSAPSVSTAVPAPAPEAPGPQAGAARERSLASGFADDIEVVRGCVLVFGDFTAPPSAAQARLLNRMLGAEALLIGEDGRLAASKAVAGLVTDPPYGKAYRAGKAKYGTGGTKSGGSLAASVKAGGGHGAARRTFTGADSEIHGDAGPFDPSALLALGVPSLVFGANYFSEKLPGSQNWVVWSKAPDTAAGKFSFAEAELAWCSESGSVRVVSHTWFGMVRKGSRELNPRLHPTQKPVEVMDHSVRYLDVCSKSDLRVVMDPYMGSATTAVAALANRKAFIGWERDRAHFDAAVERLKGLPDRLLLDFRYPVFDPRAVRRKAEEPAEGAE